MKFRMLSILLVLGDSVHASSYSELVSANPAHPDHVIANIQKLKYENLLNVLQDTYAKFDQTGDPMDAVGIGLLHAMVGPREAVSLYLDCDIKRGNMSDKYQSILAIYHLLLNNPALLQDAGLDGRIATDVKAELISLSKQGAQNATQSAQLKYDIARYGANVLVLLNDDAGLDILLTELNEVTELSRRDNWNDKRSSHFQDLSRTYAARAKGKGVDGDNESLRAAYYQLCFLRQQNGLALSPRHPVIDLGLLEREREKQIIAK